MKGQQLELFVLEKGECYALMSHCPPEWVVTFTMAGKHYEGRFPSRLEAEKHAQYLVGSKNWDRKIAKIFQLMGSWHATIDDKPIGTAVDEAGIKTLVFRVLERR